MRIKRRRARMKIKFNKKNFFIAIALLAVVNIVGPFFIDPETETGSLFYFAVGFTTALLLPFLSTYGED
jgi:hypothetical protein